MSEPTSSPATVPTPTKRTYKKRKDAGHLKKSQGHHQTIDIREVARLRLQNRLSWAEVSKIMGKPISTLHHHLKGLATLFDSDRADVYEQNKPILLSRAEEILLLNMMDEDKLQKASTNNVAYAFQQVNNANRLSRGQATSNVCVASMVVAGERDLLKKIPNAT